MNKIKSIFKKISSYLIVPCCGIMGALGGADNSSKSLRRIFIPFALFGFAFTQLENIYVITIMFLSFVFAIGYGIPDATDEGSALGRFWYKFWNKNHRLADIFTRGTVGVLASLALISIPVLKHNWKIYVLCSLGIILTYAFISWRNLGQYRLFNRNLNWSETLTYGLITLFTVILILK